MSVATFSMPPIIAYYQWHQRWARRIPRSAQQPNQNSSEPQADGFTRVSDGMSETSWLPGSKW